MPSTLFQLIVISPPENKTDEINILQSLFNSGLQIFHLRKPDFSKKDIEEYLLRISSEFYPRIVLHNHYELALKYDLKGIHLTEKSKKKTSKIFLENFSKKSISASFHAIDDVLKCRRNYEYVFFSPVFDSISKKEYASRFDNQSISALFDKIKKREKNILQVIALGGINLQTINQAKQLGFSGAAMLGGIWENDNPEKVFKEISLKIL